MTDWDPRDVLELPDHAMVRDIQKRIRYLCELWCDRGLKGVPKHELDAALNRGIGIMAWYEFCRDCHIPTATDQVRTDLYEFAWDCFRDQCLDFYAGFKS